MAEVTGNRARELLRNLFQILLEHPEGRMLSRSLPIGCS